MEIRKKGKKAELGGKGKKGKKAELGGNGGLESVFDFPCVVFADDGHAVGVVFGLPVGLSGDFVAVIPDVLEIDVVL